MRLVGPWGRAAVGATAVWSVVRIVLGLWGWLAFSSSAPRIPLPVATNFFTLFDRWDSVFYTGIATNGYTGGPASLEVAFFPGYPLVARLVTGVLFVTAAPSSGQLQVGLWLVPLVSSLVAAIVLWRLTARRFGDRIALAATVLLLAGPYSVFLAASYPESLFLALGIGAWYAATRGRWVTAVTLCALDSTIRVDGLFLAGALGVLFVTRARSRRSGSLAAAAAGKAVAVVAGGASGTLAYFAYLGVHTGNPLAWSTAESTGWKRHFRGPWSALVDQVSKIDRPTLDAAEHTQAALEILFAAAALVGVVVLIRRRWWGAAALVTFTLVSLMTNTNYESLGRETLPLFPLPILVATSLQRSRTRWIFWLVLTIGLGLLLFDSRQFVLGYWAD